MMIDYCKTNRTLQEQYTWHNIKALQWQGVEKLQWFDTRWKSFTTSFSITIPEVVIRDTFLTKIRNSKKLQPDIVEFDRMREDDSRRNLKWLSESIDRLLARDRMEWARKLQRKSLTSGAIDSDAAPGALGKKEKVANVSRKRVKAKARESEIGFANSLIPES